MLKVLKGWHNWDPIAAEEFDSKIDEKLAEEAEVNVETLRSAKNILWFDGMFGPYSDQDFAEEGHKITKARARVIIDKAREYRFSDVTYDNPEYEPICDCDEGDECTHPNCTIEGKEIYNEVWDWYRKIYG